MPRTADEQAAAHSKARRCWDTGTNPRSVSANILTGGRVVCNCEATVGDWSSLLMSVANDELR
jgi:hypothetical protein